MADQTYKVVNANSHTTGSEYDSKGSAGFRIDSLESGSEKNQSDDPDHPFNRKKGANIEPGEIKIKSHFSQQSQSQREIETPQTTIQHSSSLGRKRSSLNERGAIEIEGIAEEINDENSDFEDSDYDREDENYGDEKNSNKFDVEGEVKNDDEDGDENGDEDERSLSSSCSGSSFSIEEQTVGIRPIGNQRDLDRINNAQGKITQFNLFSSS